MPSGKPFSNPLNAIVSKLHCPPALDDRSSRRLLEALTTSFRNNLDREHGYLPKGSSTASAYSPKTSIAATSSSRNSHHRPTDRHVRAILSNPLFSYEPSKTVSSRPRTERDPMDVFDQAVAKGLMTLDRATGILIAKREAIAQSSSLSAPEGLTASGTAFRVLSWLRSSGLERDLSFVNHTSFLNNFVPFMVRERLDEAVWVWLERWMATQGHDLAVLNQATHVSPLLTALVYAKSSPGSSLDAGYATLIRADDMFSGHQAFPSTAVAPWKTLSQLSTIYAWQRPPSSEALFDLFAAMSDRLPRAPLVKIHRAHLNLYHPTHPDATAALDFLQSPLLERLRSRLGSVDKSEQPKLDSKAVFGSKIVKRVVLMAADAAQHLARTGDEAQAEWVGNLLLEKFGDLLRTQLVSASPDLHLLHPAPSWG